MMTKPLPSPHEHIPLPSHDRGREVIAATCIGGSAMTRVSHNTPQHVDVTNNF